MGAHNPIFSFFSLNKEPKKSPFQKALEQVTERQDRVTCVRFEAIPSSRYNRCKCPKVAKSLAYVRNQKNSMLLQLTK